MDDLIIVKTYNNRMEAEADKGLLENYGIRSIVSVDDCGGAYPHLTFVRGVQLLISAKDEEKAKEILRPDNK